MKDAMKVGLAALLCATAGVGVASAQSMSGMDGMSGAGSNGWVCTQYSWAGNGQIGRAHV